MIAKRSQKNPIRNETLIRRGVAFFRLLRMIYWLLAVLTFLKEVKTYSSSVR